MSLTDSEFSPVYYVKPANHGQSLGTSIHLWLIEKGTNVVIHSPDVSESMVLVSQILWGNQTYDLVVGG